MGRVLACLDGSAYFHSVCDLAAWAALRLGCDVDALHVLGRDGASSVPADLSGNLGADERESLLLELAAHDEQRAKLAQRRGRLLLDEARTRFAASGVRAEIRLRHGGIVETIAGLDPPARLVVIGKRGEAHAYADGHLGSNLERVVRSSRAPVLVASRASRELRRFLIAFDGSPSATRAVERAAASPLLRGLAGHVLSVGSGGEALATRAVGRLRDAGLAAEAHAATGEPEDALAALVDRLDIDLLVMGAYGHSRLRNLVIGSTTTAVLRATEVPVLLVRG